MFMPPVNPTRSSTTRILWWFLRLIDTDGGISRGGKKRAVSTPALRNRLLARGHEYHSPTPSIRTRTVTPRSTARPSASMKRRPVSSVSRSEEHTSELQSRGHLVCRLLLEKKKTGRGRG